MKNEKIIQGNTCTCSVSCMIYCTEEQLKDTLSRLTVSTKCDYLYICHKGEKTVQKDGTIKEAKDHIHLLLRPLSSNGFRNLQHIRSLFPTELKDGEEKSTCTNFCKTTSLYDWYMYSMHDIEYLENKGLEREFNYTEADIHGSEDLRQLCKDLVEKQNEPKESQLSIVIEGLENGLSDFEICDKLLLIDVGDYVQALRLIDEVKKRMTKDIQLTMRFYDIFENILGQNPSFNDVLMSDLKMKSETVSCAYVTDKNGFSVKDPKMYDFFVNKAHKNSKVMKLADVVLNYISTMDFMTLFEK